MERDLRRKIDGERLMERGARREIDGEGCMEID